MSSRKLYKVTLKLSDPSRFTFPLGTHPRSKIEVPVSGRDENDAIARALYLYNEKGLLIVDYARAVPYTMEDARE